MTESVRRRKSQDDRPSAGHQIQAGAVGESSTTSGDARALTVPQLLHLQRTVGNRAVRSLVGGGPVTVQRGHPKLTSLTTKVGLTKTPAEKASKAGSKAQTAKIATPDELERHVSMLESATTKIVKSHTPGSSESWGAATSVNAGAKRILGNLPPADTTASTMLGDNNARKRLNWVIAETDLILDEIVRESSRTVGEDIYTAGAQDKDAPGGLTHLGARDRFDTSEGAMPAANDKVKAFLAERGFSNYIHAFKTLVAKPDNMPADDLRGLQPELFLYAQMTNARVVAAELGLSEAERAAIQTFTAEDYQYINPATANSAGWLESNRPEVKSSDDMSMAEFQQLTAEARASGKTWQQLLDERKKERQVLQQEGSLHSAVALGGLKRMPKWKGIGYRGQRMSEGTGPNGLGTFATRVGGDPSNTADMINAKFTLTGNTMSFPTITSVSKSEAVAQSFRASGKGGPYSVLWVMKLNNARDIEGLSVKRLEREVALFPDAEFAIESIKMEDATKLEDGLYYLKITCKQIP